MAAGAKPALDPTIEKKTEASATPEAQPLSFKDRLVRKLTEIFEHNERLGSTRQ